MKEIDKCTSSPFLGWWEPPFDVFIRVVLYPQRWILKRWRSIFLPHSHTGPKHHILHFYFLLGFSSFLHWITALQYILNGFVENGKNRSKIVWLAFLFKRYPHSEWWTAFAAHWFIVRDYFAMEIIVCYYYAKALFTYNSFHNYYKKLFAVK